MDDLKGHLPLNETFESYTYIPTSPWVRRSLRGLFNNDVLRHYLMGFVSVKGKLKPIHLVCWEHSVVDDRNNKGRYYCTTCKNGGIKEQDVLEKKRVQGFLYLTFITKMLLKMGKNQNGK